MRRVAFYLGVLVAAAVAAPAAAQYSCSGPNGSYQSASPCRSSAESRSAAAAAAAAAARSGAASRSSPGIRYYGPGESDSRYQSRPASIGEAPPIVKYMSPRCSGLNDALRTASARGLNSDTISTMRKDYSRECGENENEARQLMSEELRDKSKQKQEARVSELREQDRSALRQQQCGESKRILVTKRSRKDLTEGERAELQRFEDNYRSRCG